jgi:peptidyl-prolyl cis-trans isomerase SurA
MNRLSLYSLICAISLLGNCLAGSAAKAQGQGTPIDKIVAKVDKHIVLLSELEASYLQHLANGGPTGENVKCEILQGLVVNKVLLAKAEIDSVIVDDKRVDSELDRRMQYYEMQFGSREKIEQAYGKSVEQLKAELRKALREQMTAQQMQDEITKGVKITPNEVKKFFNSIPKDSIPYFPTEVEVGHIVKAASVSKSQKAKTRAKLNEIRERIVTGGEDFEALAKTYSDDPGSGSRGGNLGYSKRGAMVPEFEATAMKLKVGEVSQVIESEFGFHIIQLLDRRGNEYNSRHILIRPSYAEVDLTEAQNYLDSLRTRILRDSITFAKAAKEYSDDKGTSSSGGLFVDPNSNSTKIFAENLDPVVYMTIDTMQLGNITPPVAYRTDDGKSAMRIVYYKTKIEPHYANLRDDWQKIYNAALGEKKNKIINEWFIKARNDVSIIVDDEFDNCNLVDNMQ